MEDVKKEIEEQNMEDLENQGRDLSKQSKAGIYILPDIMI